MDFQSIELMNNELIHSFELMVEGKRSFIDYQKKNNTVSLIHTEVPRELRGKGIAEILVEKTFYYLEEHKLKAVPLCSYIRDFIKDHPEWNRIVA
ncbi:MAG TPA: GNAT family N-acetyltransferase [Sphingobacteriaceae bacterium]|nr:GNAT family N-acetyltransferase [Sphingobacteriaceae bacterium]